MTRVVKDSPLPGDADNPKNVCAREVIAAAQAESRGSIPARMWVYRSITVPINVFDFTVSRHREGLEIFLDGFTGRIMRGTRGGRSSSRGTTVPCMPALFLSMFWQLYDIEDGATAFVPDDRLALRHAESRPIWERMREYLASKATMNVMPKELFGQALTSLRNQFEHLLVYLDDGLVPISCRS